LSIIPTSPLTKDQTYQAMVSLQKCLIKCFKCCQERPWALVGGSEGGRGLKLTEMTVLHVCIHIESILFPKRNHNHDQYEILTYQCQAIAITTVMKACLVKPDRKHWGMNLREWLNRNKTGVYLRGLYAYMW
jgi:hypothetical protein